MSAKKFHAKSSALEVIKGHDLSGKEAIVTGGASGIGVETVRALAKAGARVIIATRNLQQAQEVAQQLSKDTGSNKIEAEKLDLTSLKSVHEFSKNFLAKNRPLHYLINNAGVMACPHSYTEDGFEMQIGTNHFGHFALTMDLIPALKEGAKQSGKNARVINVSSSAHTRSGIIFDDINFKKTPYDPWKAYGQSKTANVLFSIALTKHFAKDGIYSNALMPGVILTGLQKHMDMELFKKMGWMDKDGTPDPNRFKSIEEGASTTIWACVAPDLENRGGLYLMDCTIAPIVDVSEFQKTTATYLVGVCDYAMNANDAQKLWDISVESIKKSGPV